MCRTLVLRQHMLLLYRFLDETRTRQGYYIISRSALAPVFTMMKFGIGIGYFHRTQSTFDALIPLGTMCEVTSRETLKQAGFTEHA